MYIKLNKEIIIIIILPSPHFEILNSENGSKSYYLHENLTFFTLFQFCCKKTKKDYCQENSLLFLRNMT